MALVLEDFTAAQTDYIQQHNNNNAAIEAAVNALQAQVLATIGPGAALILDVFDRDGIVGDHSYVLDLASYVGGGEIAIGRRPAPVLAQGEIDVSAAWGTFNGQLDRVTLTGDAVLDAAAITTGLPKTIYVGIPANGTPQLFETNGLPNVVYAYSMTWDGFSLQDIRRMAHILPGYPLIRSVASRAQIIGLFDPETDFVSDELGQTSVLLPGALEDNGLAEMSYEVIGFIVNAARADDDGFSAPAESTVPDDNHVKFKIVSEGEDWTQDSADGDEGFDFDCSNIPDVQFIPVAAGISADDRFVTEFRTFELERTHLGANVNSARAFYWGVVVRPLYGLPVPKTAANVDQI